MSATTPRGAPAPIALDQQPKVFGLFSMTLFAVSAMLVLDTVATSAAISVQGLSFWLILGLLFFVPYGSRRVLIRAQECCPIPTIGMSPIFTGRLRASNS